MSNKSHPARERVRKYDKFNSDDYEYVGGTRKKRTEKVRIDIEVTIELSLN